MPRKRRDDPWGAVAVGDALLPDYSVGADPGAYELELPSGHKVSCNSQHEREMAEITARPYVDNQASIPPEDWILVANFLQSVVMADRIRRTIGSPNFKKLPPASQREHRALLNSLDDEMRQFMVKRIDPLRASRGDDNLTMADVRRSWEVDSSRYCEENIGETEEVRYCPNPLCEHHLRPYLVCGERAHWATDPASGSGYVWNEEVACLVHLYYCTQQGCDHKAHDMHLKGSLSVGDAAKILRISPIGLIAVAYERSFNLAVDADLDHPDSLAPFLP